MEELVYIGEDYKLHDNTWISDYTLELNTNYSSVREVAEYESEKSFVVEVQRALSGLRYTALIALERSHRTTQRQTRTVSGSFLSFSMRTFSLSLDSCLASSAPPGLSYAPT
ncbi:hypothetical protein Syun_008583 [Stephania yunnanensis]|uniref:Uncharacterized protein n=1 Tax=Stephania yunnanensis TaxID=152371 RepID=A0AAP0KEW0_9MAGN